MPNPKKKPKKSGPTPSARIKRDLRICKERLAGAEQQIHRLADRKTNTPRKFVGKMGSPRVGAALERERATVKRLRRELREARAPKKNPKRKGPPRAWWRACMASVEASRSARVPAAVCYAAWWKRPAKERARIVRAMHRSANPRERRAAIALCKAEEKRHMRHMGRRPNPPREVVEIVYEEQKPGDDEPYEYVHTFEGERPKLTMRAGRMQIDGGSYRTRGGWLYG